MISLVHNTTLGVASRHVTSSVHELRRVLLRRAVHNIMSTLTSDRKTSNITSNWIKMETGEEELALLLALSVLD